jgi:hypothetical protein
VFLCFFVGNDFIPHLPSLHIREGAIDSLLLIYKNFLPSLGGYIADEGTLDFGRVDVLMGKIGQVEDELFKMKTERNRYQKNNQRGGGYNRGGYGGRGGGGYQNNHNRFGNNGQQQNEQDPKREQEIQGMTFYF